MILIWWFLSDYYVFVFDIISSVVGWLVSVIGLLTSCVTFLGGLFNALPVIFRVSLVGLVAVSVIYKILGREGQD